MADSQIGPNLLRLPGGARKMISIPEAWWGKSWQNHGWQNDRDELLGHDSATHHSAMGWFWLRQDRTSGFVLLSSFVIWTSEFRFRSLSTAPGLATTRMARRGLTGQATSQAPQPVHFARSTSGCVEKPSAEV
jgi:hypothetical protein